MSQQLWEMGGRLVGNAIAQGVAKSRAERQRIEARPPRSRFRPVQAQLPADAWYVGAELRVGYPWGWAEVEPFDSNARREGLLVLLEAERSDGVLAQLIVSQCDGLSEGQLLDAAATHEQDRAKALKLEPHADMSYVLVDGEPALVVQLHGKVPSLSAGSSVVTEVATVHRGRLYQAQLLAPEKDHLAYIHVLWTLLATWTWRP
jgi:hypothetical protein